MSGGLPMDPTVPAPTPTTGVDPGAAQQANAVAAAAGVNGLPNLSDSSGSGQDYGLAQWAGATFDLSGIFGQQMTGEQALNAFIAAGQGANPSLAARIQKALVYGDLYPNKTFQPTYGQVGPEDARAFASALNILGRANQNRGGQGQPPAMSVGDYLQQVTAAGAAGGVFAGSQAAKSVIRQVQLPATADLVQTALDAAQKALGERLSPEQAAKFASEYRQMVGGAQHAADVAEVNAMNAPAPQDTGPLPPGSPTGPAPAPGKQATLDRQDQYQSSLTYDPTAPDAQSAYTVMPQFSQNIDAITSALDAQLGDQSSQPAVLNEYTTEAPVSDTVAATNYARATHPQQAATHDLGEQLGNFIHMLASHWGGAA